MWKRYIKAELHPKVELPLIGTLPPFQEGGGCRYLSKDRYLHPLPATQSRADCGHDVTSRPRPPPVVFWEHSAPSTQREPIGRPSATHACAVGNQAVKPERFTSWFPHSGCRGGSRVTNDRSSSAADGAGLQDR